MNWKIEIVKGNRRTWREYRSEGHWKRTKKTAAGNAFGAFLWDMDNKEIIDGIYE